MRTTALQRFEAKYIPEPNSGCYLWDSCYFDDGYGAFWLGGGKTERAPRMAWLLYRGGIPDGMLVLHTCDTPACVNPAHLYLGTCRDNTQDMMRRGRHVPTLGERDGGARLTEGAVRAIRASDLSNKELAAMYEVDASTISYARRSVTWRHVN